ncbi:glycosyltransferase [Sphingomicrobium sediminis]|uniref:Glycosyltransferase family 2 protein n=1 Tax=Sphingomicrobium sediminis TaxID=2950949 RepID=A0A9X2EGA3_9SPHN|nr:glycosyltransferase family 2 protein [Sphingomicrobium sediminis]MCM8557463.1 glycosyltransferase family 2 protein [Sphingomicrobium sediminis]
MKTALFLAMLVGLVLMMLTRPSRPSQRRGCVDAVLPAYNEQLCIAASVEGLLSHPMIDRVIVVNDGSTDGTRAELDLLARRHGTRLVAIHQANTGKGGALMRGIGHVRTEAVFLTDADTLIPHDLGLAHLLGEIERGADAVGGIPSSNLVGAGLLPHIRATVKLPMIALRRTFQQMLGGAPFIVSGACGMFRVSALRATGFCDRTKVEDLDLSWTLVARGYRVRHSNRCVVFPQECNNVADEWRRWRRWIVGYAVCMRLHWPLLSSRFGLFSILPMFLVVAVGIMAYLTGLAVAATTHFPVALIAFLFPLLWVAIVSLIGAFSAWHHRCAALIPLAPFALFYVLLSYTIWAVHGLAGLLTGREPKRDKPTRYAPQEARNVVD